MRDFAAPLKESGRNPVICLQSKRKKGEKAKDEKLNRKGPKGRINSGRGPESGNGGCCRISFGNGRWPGVDAGGGKGKRRRSRFCGKRESSLGRKQKTYWKVTTRRSEGTLLARGQVQGVKAKKAGPQPVLEEEGKGTREFANVKSRPT